MRATSKRLGPVVLLSFVVVAQACGAEDEAAGIPPAGTDGGGGATDGGGTTSDGSTALDGSGVDGGTTIKDGSATDAPLDAPTDGNVVVDSGACVAPTLPKLKVVNVASAAIPNALFAAQPPGSDDWYVVSQDGVIRIVRAGNVLATPFLDISAAMGTNLGERGLLSIAFHPNYASNGRFFVMGTPADSPDGTFAASNADAVVEFKRSAGNADVADGTKVQDIVVLPASASNHNGGTIAFGPDGKLYMATGDGGGGCESAEPDSVQDTTKLFGKILRFDVDIAAPFAAAGNPFNDDKRVYHYGLRNPFRWSFDSATGDLYIGDVGQDSYEEISLAVGNAAGKNFGWPAFEGAVGGTCSGKSLGGPSPHTPPIVSIDRRGGSSSPFADYSSIIGGRVYRGSAIPSLYGVYLFSDYGGAEMGALKYCNGQVKGPVVLQKSAVPTPQGTLNVTSSFAEGHDGEIYLTYGGGGGARLGKLVPQ